MTLQSRLDNSRVIRAPRGPGAHRQELGRGGGDAHADEQSRPGGRREAGGAGRLWRHRPGGARLGLLRRHRGGAEGPRARRNAARAVRQAGRRVPHHDRCAARAPRQLQPRAGLGDLGAFPRARPQGPDDVRPDDGRLLDLYRLAGHRAGHLRDLRRGRAAALWRRPLGPLDPDRRARRHGRRAAPRRHHGRRLDARRRMPDEPHREAAPDPLSRPLGPPTLDEALAHARRGQGGRQADLGRAPGQCRRDLSGDRPAGRRPATPRRGPTW